MSGKSFGTGSGPKGLRHLMIGYIYASLGLMAAMIAISAYSIMRAGENMSVLRFDVVLWAVIGLASPRLAVFLCWRAWAIFSKPDPNGRKAVLQLAGCWSTGVTVFLPALLWEPPRSGMGDGTAGRFGVDGIRMFSAAEARRSSGARR